MEDSNLTEITLIYDFLLEYACYLELYLAFHG